MHNISVEMLNKSAFHTASKGLWCADGEIHVTLKDGKPYSLWNIVSLAHHATQGVLVLKTTRLFHPGNYPGDSCLIYNV